MLDSRSILEKFRDNANLYIPEYLGPVCLVAYA